MPETNNAAASNAALAERPLQVVSACRARDLPVLEIAVRWLPRMVPVKTFIVVSPNQECRRIQARLGQAAQVIPEDDFIPGMTLAAVRQLPVAGFPRDAGWYFQQLLKLQFACLAPEDDFYLIWDADTVPLRPLRFFDREGRMLLTQADEYHAPYFDTYRRLLGEEPNREFSFIAQHLLVRKSIVREMAARIEQHVPGEGGWAWKIMRALPASGANLFSEYETYGHYVKNHRPGEVRFIRRQWRRELTDRSGCAVPSETELAALAQSYDYAAFERAGRGWRRLARRALAWWRSR